jgi:hypothetical protein
MTAKLLLPNGYKKIGWFILVPATLLGIVLIYNQFEAAWFTAKVFAIATDGTFGKYKFLSFINIDLTNTIVGSLFISGAMLVSFSKEKNEDEYIAGLRLSSLLWAVFASYTLLLVSFVFVYGTPFLDVMIYNMFTVLIIFIIRFNYLMYKNSKTPADEK